MLGWSQSQLGYERGHGAKLRKERRSFAREQASALTEAALEERRLIEAAENKRLRMTEAGLGRRLGREQEFARPLRAAEIGMRGARAGLRGAETEAVRYGTEFERGTRGTLEDIIRTSGRLGGAKAEEAEIGLKEERRAIRLRDKAEREAEEAARPLEISTAAAKPSKRKLRPSISKYLRGLPTLPGGASLEQYKSIADWLRSRTKKAYEYAYPRTR